MISLKKILIFGATGNVGIYFTDYCKNKLSNEYEIIAIGRKNTSYFQDNKIQYINVDICKEEDFELIPTNNIYAIVNLAGIVPAYVKMYNPYEYVECNIMGSLRILEFARKNNVDRIIYTQTWADLAGYWDKIDLLEPMMSRKLCYTGDHALYSITKCTVLDMMKHYKEEYGIKDFIFRLPNIYLYNPRKTYYVNGIERPIRYRYMIDKAIRGQDIELWGDPEAYKDIIYVKDLCQMMYKALFVNRDGGIYNAGTGIKTTLKEQIEGIITTFTPKNRISNIIYIPTKKSFTSFVMDIQNARDELGYEPQYTYIDYLKDYKIEMEKKRFDDIWKDSKE